MAGVYLIYQNRIFGDAVRAVLATYPGIELLGATGEPDAAAAEVARLDPAVILLEQGDDGGCSSTLDRILTGRRVCRLITLRPDDDGMRVWSGTWLGTVQSQDLVQAIVSAGEEQP